MQKSLFKLLLIFSLLAGIACDEVIEEDLTDDELIILTPPRNFISNASAINFFWNELERVEGYRLQIARPNFGSPVEIVIDSLYTGNQAQVVLGPGVFEWRMRAENPNSSTPYEYGMVTVDSTGSLMGINMILDSPDDNTFQNTDSIQLLWVALQNASEYRVELYNESTSLVIETVVTINTERTIEVPSEGQYSWSVQALNDFSVSNATERSFLMEQIDPPAVLSSSPADDAEVSDPDVDFLWTIPSDVGDFQSPRAYKLEVSSDSLFPNFLFGTPISTAIDSLRITLETGTFYWRIESVDEAGNGNVYSEVRKIEVTL